MPNADFFSSYKKKTLKLTILDVRFRDRKLRRNFAFRRFGYRYDEFGHDSFTKSYQKSEIFLVVQFKYVWRTLGRLNHNKFFGLRHTNLKTWSQNFEIRNHDFVKNVTFCQISLTKKTNRRKIIQKTIKFHQFRAHVHSNILSILSSKKMPKSRFQKLSKL